MRRLAWRVFHYLNPIAHFGDLQYPYFFPFVTTLLTAVAIELYTTRILMDPGASGTYVIFIFIVYIIYFALRVGILGGFITAGITIAYYLYVIYSRNYRGNDLVEGLQATVIFAVIYFLLAGIIGWLKERVDVLLEEEVYQKKHLESIIQQLPIGVVITDKHGKIVQANKEVNSILGRKINPGTYVTQSTPLISSYKRAASQLTRSPLITTIATGKPISRKGYLAERPDGKVVQMHISTTVIRNSEGKMTGAVAIVSDITQEKDLERRKDDFVNMASHELKTPITSMKLYIESLLMKTLNTKDAKAIKMILSIKYQTERLQELVSDLLDVSRLQTGKLTFNREKLQLHDLITETVEQLADMSQGKKLTYSARSKAVVYADKYRIYQVITNLITNAVKYSPEGSEIKISLTKQQGKAVVSVQDRGIGISKANQKMIFKRLYQVLDEDKKTFAGLGMGLYISANIIKRHKGTIHVKSEKGKGSTFYFSLPLYGK